MSKYKTTVRVYKGYLDEQDVCSNMILPIMMMQSAMSMYGECATISEMWSIISKCKKINKSNKDSLVELFREYFNDDTITFDSEIKFYDDDDTSYVIISFKDVYEIVKNTRAIDDICSLLTLLIVLQSFFNGEFTYKTKNELLQCVNEYNPYNSSFNINNPNTWFKYWKTKDLEDFAKNFICYASYDYISRIRYSNDNNAANVPLYNARTLDRRARKLEEMGIICKVHTNYGQYANKAVYCRVEHKEIAEALYNQIWENKQLAKKKAKEPKDEEDGG